MIVRYNQLSRLETPALTLCSPGSVYHNGELSNVVGVLTDHEAEEIVFNFNATSELNFRINKIEREDPDENAYVQRMYQAVQNRRLVFVEDIGYFMISNIDDGFDGVKHYKDVKAKSIDVELAQKIIPYIEDGTYPFMTDATNQSKGIFETIVESLPLWTIGEVDENVAVKWRTFTDLDSSLNCLSFLLQNCQDAFECIFVFDPIHRTISVYSQDNYVRRTNIHITKHDLVNSLDITENADDLYTAISVMGDGDVTVSAINPLGSNVIYNFDYYLSWMPKELGEKVAAWQNAVKAEKSNYYTLNLGYFRQFEAVSTYELQIQNIDTQIKMYQRCRDNIVAESDTTFVDGYNAEITENGGEAIIISDKIDDTLAHIDGLIKDCNKKKADVQIYLDDAKKKMDEYSASIKAITDRLAIKSCFTEEEYTELCLYIFEGNYTDEYVILTEGMSYEDKFEQMKILYDRAEAQLSKASAPTQEFNIDVENFLFSKEFEQWGEQLETGCLINVELEVNDVAALFLSSMTVNYDDHRLSMTFGNRFNKFDPKSLFDDVLGNITKTANTLTYIKDILYPIKNGEFDSLKEALATSRSLTMGQALSSVNEEVVIDGSGYTGRKKLDDGTYDAHQIKITGKNIVFTDDSWDTCKVAIGSLVLGNGASAYGINAETIMGEIIVGGRINLLNESGNLSFTDDGFDVTNGTNSFVVNPNSRSLLSISKGTKKLLFVDTDGNLNITGAVTATSGEIGGCSISGGVLKIGNANIGEKLTASSIDASELKVSAVNITDKLTAEQINTEGLIAENISGDTISGKTISGGTISIGNSFSVSDTGVLTCSGASISGTITTNNISVTGGTIGIGNSFSVSNEGFLTCSGANISGTLTAGEGSKIGDFSVGSKSMRYGDTIGSSGCICLYPSGTTSAYTIGGVDTSGWAFTVGDKFGITTSGSIYSTGGKIGGWKIDASHLEGQNPESTWYRLTPSGLSYRWSSGGDYKWASTSWSGIWNAGANYSTNHSDKNIKNSISDIDDYNLLFDNLKPCRYKYNDGTSNRYHTGFIAQDVVEALDKANLTTQDFAGVIHFQHPSEDGSEWALRRDEFVALNTWQIQKAKVRIAELESKIKYLEDMVKSSQKIM